MERDNSVLCLFSKPRGQLGMTEGTRTHPKGTGNTGASAAGLPDSPKKLKIFNSCRILGFEPTFVPHGL